jgi:serine/threonine protein kinase
MLGRLLHGRYRVTRVLGGGGMAVVYEGTDERLDRPVAVKVLADNLATDDSARRRFLREARLAGRLSHPGVVDVYDSGQEDTRPFIVMELIGGTTLAEVLHRRGPLPADEVAGIGACLASALAHAHEEGLVHRDVKPANVLVDDRGAVKLVDFGIARLTGDGTRLTETGTVLGTAAYISPEQVEGRDAGPPADVYGLGALLYELLTGTPPYPAMTLVELAEHRQQPIAPPSELEPSVPPALDELVIRCLETEPDQRPTASDVATQLSEAPTKVLRAAPAETRVLARRRRPSWLRIAVPAAVLVVAGVLAGTLLLPSGDSDAPPAQPSIAPVPRAETPAAQARALAQWVERYSR